MKTLTFLFVFLLLISNANAVNFTNCTSGQQDGLIEAIQVAQTLSINAYYHLYNGRDIYLERWFGKEISNDKLDQIQFNFLKINENLNNALWIFDCVPDNGAYYASVNPILPYHIKIYDLYWTLPVYGFDSRAGTLIHEVSHFLFVLGTIDFAANEEQSLELARDTHIAYTNANTYEFYAEDLGKPLDKLDVIH